MRGAWSVVDKKAGSLRCIIFFSFSSACVENEQKLEMETLLDRLTDRILLLVSPLFTKIVRGFECVFVSDRAYKARVKRRTSHGPDLMPIWVDSNN